MSQLNDSAGQSRNQEKCRAPTHKEAVEICLSALSRNQVIANLRYWADRYGREFSEQVKQEYVRRKKK